MIDTTWFHKKIDASEVKSLSGLAARMTNRLGNPMDRASLHKLITGKARMEMSVSEAIQIAEILGLDLKEVVLRASGKLRGPQDKKPRSTSRAGIPNKPKD